jgi:RNA polymerase sigma-70 factor (ECF subfamily)
MEEYAYVRRSLERLGVGTADVDDACQELWLKVRARFDEYDPEKPLRPWLFAFAARVAANERRLARHHRETSTRSEPRASGPDPERLTERAEQRALLLRALSSLDARKREILVLCDLDGVATSVAADTLGIPLNTVYSRLREGRSDLRRALTQIGGGS